MATLARQTVSGNKRRFIEDGFDLDLSYITDHIVAMGFPSQNLEGLFRNPMEEVQRFFETRHRDQYKIYNLCAERGYNPSFFHGRVECFPFDDHNVPVPLDMIERFCVSCETWLKARPGNVVGIHCKAGKGRTGLMICCLLLHCSLYPHAEDALRHYGAFRTFDRLGVTIPSQRRYVHYYEKVLLNRSLSQPPYPGLRLEALRMSCLAPGTWYLSFKMQENKVTVFDSHERLGLRRTQSKASTQVVDFDLRHHHVILRESVKLSFYQHSFLDTDKLFYTWHHTSFVEQRHIVLKWSELDKPSADLGRQIVLEMFLEGHGQDLALNDSAQGYVVSAESEPTTVNDEPVAVEVNIIHKAWLRKRKKGRLQRWLRRLCVVCYEPSSRTTLMRYYEDEASRLLKGEIDMSSVYHIQRSSSKSEGGNSVFEIVLRGKVHQFEASSPEAADELATILTVPLTMRVVDNAALDLVRVGWMYVWLGCSRTWAKRLVTLHKQLAGQAADVTCCPFLALLELSDIISVRSISIPSGKEPENTSSTACIEMCSSRFTWLLIPTDEGYDNIPELPANTVEHSSLSRALASWVQCFRQAISSAVNISLPVTVLDDDTDVFGQAPRPQLPASPRRGSAIRFVRAGRMCVQCPLRASTTPALLCLYSDGTLSYTSSAIARSKAVSDGQTAVEAWQHGKDNAAETSSVASNVNTTQAFQTNVPVEQSMNLRQLMSVTVIGSGDGVSRPSALRVQSTNRSWLVHMDADSVADWVELLQGSRDLDRKRKSMAVLDHSQQRVLVEHEIVKKRLVWPYVTMWGGVWCVLYANGRLEWQYSQSDTNNDDNDNDNADTLSTSSTRLPKNFKSGPATGTVSYEMDVKELTRIEVHRTTPVILVLSANAPSSTATTTTTMPSPATITILNTPSRINCTHAVLAFDDIDECTSWADQLHIISPAASFAVCSHNDLPAFEIFSGWLLKFPPSVGKPQKRFFSLMSDHTLHYYQDERERSKGVIDMSTAMLIRELPDTLQHKNEFEITTSSRIFRMRTETALQRSMWARRLQAVVHAVKDVSVSDKIVRSGILMKSGALNPTLKQRFFVLFASGALSYYSVPPGGRTIKPTSRVEISNLKLHGEINLDFVHTVTHPFKQQATIMGLVDATDRTWLLCCDDAAECALWVHDIQHVRRSRREHISPMVLWWGWCGVRESFSDPSDACVGGSFLWEQRLVVVLTSHEVLVYSVSTLPSPQYRLDTSTITCSRIDNPASIDLCDTDGPSLLQSNARTNTLKQPSNNINNRSNNSLDSDKDNALCSDNDDIPTPSAQQTRRVSPMPIPRTAQINPESVVLRLVHGDLVFLIQVDNSVEATVLMEKISGLQTHIKSSSTMNILNNVNQSLRVMVESHLSVEAVSLTGLTLNDFNLGAFVREHSMSDVAMEDDSYRDDADE